MSNKTHSFVKLCQNTPLTLYHGFLVLKKLYLAFLLYCRISMLSRMGLSPYLNVSAMPVMKIELNLNSCYYQ